MIFRMESLCERFAHGLETLDCDVLVSTGGVSMGGEVDLVKRVLSERFGGAMQFGQLRMKPGKPTAFYTLQRPTRSSIASAAEASRSSTRYVFALPGNPVSAIVTCLLLVLPALRALAGAHEPAFRRIPVRVCRTLLTGSVLMIALESCDLYLPKLYGMWHGTNLFCKHKMCSLKFLAIIIANTLYMYTIYSYKIYG